MNGKPAIKLYLCVEHGGLDELKANSPGLSEAIAEETQCAVMRWDGRAASLPYDEMVLVYMPDSLPEYDQVLDICDQLCHFPFYLNQALQRSYQVYGVVVAFRMWLDEYHREPAPP